ncbi:ATP-binding cassette domain-containing protein [Bradyrhizobium japonicum]
MLGGIAGLLIGFPTFRLQGHYFALAMLAYPLAILYVFEWLGFQEVTLPIKRDAPIAYMQFSDPHIYTLLGLAIMLATIVLTQVIERSRFGMALLAIKQNEAAAEAAGINTLAWKLRAITLSGAIAAAIGGFYVQVLLVVTPQSVFGMLVSAQALTVAMFGGVGTVWGPVIGSVILIPLAEILHAEAGARIPGIQGVIFGLAIVCVILLAPEGLFWKLRDLLRKRNASKATASDTPEAAAANVTALKPAARQRSATGEVVLEGSRPLAFLWRTQSRSGRQLQAAQERILGIIGPNGAGKTTLFNLLNGFLKPSEGEVLIDGRNMSGQRPHTICEAGVGRTFQVMRPFLRMSILDNVVVGAYVRARSDAEARKLAADAVARVGLSAVANRVAGELSTKELRLMELARAIAGQPRILLLDETLAGLGHGEADEVVAVIQQLARDGMTIAIIEHTMQAMVRLVDRFLVLDHGAVITEGLPEVVTRDNRVIEAYLGKKWVGHAAN